jgi:PAS domain-containing protein
MHVETETPDDVLRAAIGALLRQGGGALRRALDGLPAAVYATDAAGVVTHFSRACVAFAGRTPRVGRDRWCVTWRLYTEDGEHLAHDRCPMAVAIRDRRAVWGVRAVAERPDGAHVEFEPQPTPLLDAAGNLVAAVNLLAEVTGPEQARSLRVRAARCRRLVGLWPGRRAALVSLAADYEGRALAMEREDGPAADAGRRGPPAGR